MELITVVEYWTTAVTFLMMASGLPPCYSMFKNKTTKNVPFIFFLISTMNSVFGACYGTLSSNFMLFIINAIGSFLWGFYILVYVYVSKLKMRSIGMVVIMIIVAASHLKYVSLFPVHEQKTSIFGQIMFSWSIILLLTPALDIVSVVQQGTSDGMSISLLIGCALASLSWFLYGYLIKDIYIYGPNIPGTLVNIGKFIVLFAYKRPSKAATKVE